MRKSLVVSAVAALLAASTAVAGGPPPGKGKPPTTGENCKPKVTVVLKGTLAATPGAGATSLSVNATKGNKFGQAYVKLAQPLSIGVDGSTKVRRRGANTVADLLSGDRVLVQARVCKADLALATLPALMALRVVAHPAKTTTTTTTTTTTSS
jgi:hypothetical protein